jgi:hypothetical protein
LLAKEERNKQTLEEKTLQHQLEINIRDEWVELKLDGSVFKLGLDDRGLPLFPESVKKELPPYMPEMVEKIVNKMRHGPSKGRFYQNIDHKLWCVRSCRDL